MDREVYSDPDLGAMIDSLFVPVRVDRDERPDVAQRYQGAVLSLAGLRGYPLTVFLTPDGSPFFGGTYFPADDPVTGRGLKQLLPDVARDFRDRRDVLVRHAAVVRQLALSRALGAHGVLRPQALAAEVEAVRGSLASAVTSGHAVTSVASTQSVALLVTEYIRSGDTAALTVARTALDAMLDTEIVAAATSDEPREIVRASLARILGGSRSGTAGRCSPTATATRSDRRSRPRTRCAIRSASGARWRRSTPYCAACTRPAAVCATSPADP
jgi:hypothetical protein